MATMNISLPDDMKGFIDEQVAERSYTSSSEFIRDLVRREQDLHRFRSLIAEGLESGPGVEVNDEYFESLHRRIADAAS